MTDDKKIGFLFDLDGVIIDSETRYTEIWAEINQRFPTGVTNFERRIKGLTLDTILKNYFSANDRPEVIKILKEREQMMSYSYCNGAAELLENLSDAKLPVALVTSSNDKKMSHLWCQMPNLKNRFNVIIDGNMVKRSKPDPEGYLKGASLIGVKPEHCVVFEDSLQGVMAGRATGAYVIGVTGTMEPSTLLPYSDCIVDSLLEVNLESLCKILANRKSV